MELEKHMDKMDGKLDDILGVVSDIKADRAVMKDNISRLEKVDSATRLTKIETSRNTMGKVIAGAFAGISCLIGLLKYVG